MGKTLPATSTLLVLLTLLLFLSAGCSTLVWLGVGETHVVQSQILSQTWEESVYSLPRFSPDLL